MLWQAWGTPRRGEDLSELISTTVQNFASIRCTAAEISVATQKYTELPQT